LFFERFREALARLPVGLIRPGPPATTVEIAVAEATLANLANLRRSLPPSYAAFLASFDGADLFHEAVVLAGVGPGATRRLVELNDMRDVAGKDFSQIGDQTTPRPLVFAEATGGDRYAFGPGGRILRLRSESDEIWMAGGDFGRWLDGLLAYHRVVYGPDGEFAPDAFEPDGMEVVPRVVLKQTERALRLCPDSAEWHQERGVALRRVGRLAQAKQAFVTAAGIDPDNPWPRFDLGRAALELGPAAAGEAGQAFEAAARLDGGESASRLWAWAARAAALEAAPARLAFCRREALTRDPGLLEELRRARDAAQNDGEPEELAQAEALLHAMEAPAPIPSGRFHLPVIRATSQHPPDDGMVSDAGAAARPARRPPPPDRRRPSREGPPRSGASRPGRRR